MPKYLPEPFKYGQIKDYETVLANGSWAIKNPDAQFARCQLPGAGIIRKWRQLAAGDMLSDEQRFELLFMVFVEQSRALGWSWHPLSPCMTAKLIDREIDSAECAAFAYGLYTLGIAPTPFGLGLSSGDGVGRNLKFETFSGIKIDGQSPGFISAHPTAGVLGLVPNVYTPVGLPLPGRLRGQSFYKWLNHKVVGFTGTWFDPTYGQQYAQIDDMWTLKIVDWEVLGRVKPASLAIFDELAETDPDGRHLLVCRDRSDHTFYLRCTPCSLQASENRFQGPFTPAQRDWLAGQLTGGARTAVRADEIFSAA